MPTLSQYWFRDRFFAGPVDGFNQPYGGWAWISNSGGSAATLVWNRQDNEQVVDLGSDLSNPLVTNAVDGLLPSGVSRTSGVKAAGVFWPDVPYHGRDPSRHHDSDMLVRVYFDFHVSTPWYCSDADGSISYYLVIFLDSTRHLAGFVDGWGYHYDGGGPFCTGSINSRAGSAVAGAIGKGKGLLKTALGLVTNTFSMIYFLPGSGTKAPGGFSENADDDVAIAALP